MAFGFPTASYSAEVDLGVERQAAREAIRSTLEVLGWQHESPHSDLYLAKMPFSSSSWGEKVSIRFSDSGYLEVDSRCSPIPQLFDWGKNKKNVETFLELVAAKAARISKMNSLAEPHFDTSESTPLERVLADDGGEP